MSKPFIKFSTPCPIFKPPLRIRHLDGWHYFYLNSHPSPRKITKKSFKMPSTSLTKLSQIIIQCHFLDTIHTLFIVKQKAKIYVTIPLLRLLPVVLRRSSSQTHSILFFFCFLIWHNIHSSFLIAIINIHNHDYHFIKMLTCWNEWKFFFFWISFASVFLFIQQ